MFFSLDNKVVVITGSAQGVGQVVAKRFKEAGADVILVDINPRGTETAAELGGRFYQVDVSDENKVKEMMEDIKERYGRIDVLVNSAAIIIPEEDIQDVDVASAKRLFDINYFGYFNMIKYAVPLLPDNASIINMASNAGVQAFPGYSAYNSSKGAIILLTRTVALELASRGIRVNSICPASIDTPMVYQEGCENELKMATYCWPLGRMCKPEEVAALAHFLAADDCLYITGEDVQIDGGYTAGIGRTGMMKWIED